MPHAIRKTLVLWAVTLCRLLLAATFIVSGFVKAADPMGMFYKLNAYFTHWGMPFADNSLPLTVAVVLLSTLEFILGIYLLLGIRRHFTTTVTLLFMAGMTLFTAYIYAYNPVADCGCFGEALTLTNKQTLAKNIVLTAAATVVMLRKRYLLRLITERNQWITSLFSWVYIVLLNLYSLQYLPAIDFTPFKTGTDMRAAYYEPGENTAAALIGFDCATASGESMTDSILMNRGYTFLMTMPDIALADDGCNDRIKDLFDAFRVSSYAFYAMTAYATTEDDINKWTDRTGAAYPFLYADTDQIKAMVRSNPGLMLVKDGKILKKWSKNDLPELDGNGKWVKTTTGLFEHFSLFRVMLWFIVPLILITLLDRLWIGSKYYKHYIFKKRLNKTQTT